MSGIYGRPTPLGSLQRALLGQALPQLRQASIELDPALSVVRLRFEYDDKPSETVCESGSCAASEVIADFPAPWNLDEHHVVVPYLSRLAALTHVAYLRWEPEHAC
jgi:hypothetical protein